MKILDLSLKNKINEKIDLLFDKYFSFWLDLCKQESPTDNKEGVDKVNAIILDFIKDLDYTVEINEQQNVGNCLRIIYNPLGKEKPFSLCAHSDTVFPVGTLDKQPPKIENDTLYCPGCADDKSGIVCGLFCLEIIKSLNITARPVQLLIHSDEENNSRLCNLSTINYIADTVKDSIACFNLEAKNELFKGLCLERKGIVTYSVKVKGKATHAGFCFDGTSAILEASKKIQKLEKFKRKNGITVNCGTINGGTSPNTVPEECEFKLDIRISNEKEKEKIKKIVEKTVAKSFVKGTVSTCSVISERPPMQRTERNYELLDKINEIYAQYGMPVFTPFKTNGGSDAANISFKVACIDSIGVKGGGFHTLNEYAKISSLKEAVLRVTLPIIIL